MVAADPVGAKTAGPGRRSGMTTDAYENRGQAALGADGERQTLGDAQARGQLDALFRAQAPRLFRALTRRMGGRDDAADLLQEAFLRLTRIAAHRTLLNPEAYLQRVTRNLLRDRAKNIAGAFERSHAPLDPERHAARDSGPLETLEALEMLDRYSAALGRLPRKTREIFLRHRIDGLTYAQIAAEVGLGVSAVEKHMMKAIAHFDRVLGRPR
jgi:RNA polymerase sigma factor (sigma-70 family)